MDAGLNLGVILLSAGLLLGLLAWAALRLAPRLSASRESQVTQAAPLPDASKDGVVVIHPGGRVGYINARARDWFALPPDAPPDLDELMRRVRPSDDFLDICATPGHLRLNVNGRPLEVTSYQVPGAHPQMLLSLRTLEITPGIAARGGEVATSTLAILAEFSASITSSLDLESVIRSVLDSTYRLVPADVLELSVWDQQTGSLAAYRLLEANGTRAKLVQSAEGQFHLLTLRTARTRQALILADSSAIGAELGDSQLPGVQAYVGIPLLAGEDLVGVLDVAQTSVRDFSSHDFELLQLVAPQIAAALRNAILYEQERRRALEYSGLAGVSQAVGAIRQPEELFAKLVEAVAPLFDVQILGFLLYDEARQVLEAQVPFRGLPPHIVRMYRVRIEPGGPAEALLRTRKPILAANAADDENWRTLGLTDLALAASLRDSILMPLVAAGQVRGFLQLSHRSSASQALPESEMRLLQIVSDQVAAIIDSAILVRQTGERNLRSQAMGTLVDLTASAATVAELLSSSLSELRTLFRSDAAAVLLLDESRGELRLHAGSSLDVPPEVVTKVQAVLIDEPAFMDTVTGSRRPLRSGRLSLDAQLPPYYRSLFAALSAESAIIVPLIARSGAG